MKKYEEWRGMISEKAVKLIRQDDICRHLGISRSVYYRWRRKSREETAKQEIGTLCQDHKFRYCRKGAS
ncbi:helix-turn-helix domain-containing protein [Bacillus sp. YC2]|nr:helix-turn-helix domain-containing protein [Bacillus sp. YC2]